MSQKDDRTPEEEVKDTQTEEETTEEETSEEEESTEEQTLDSLQNEKPKTPDAIPYDRFKEVNDKLKDSNDIIADLTAKLEAKQEPVTRADATRGLDELAKEHNLDADVLGKVAAEIKAAALAEVQQEIAPITQAQKAAEANKVFETMYADALKNNPQYKDVANKDIVKQLAFNPANANKTFPQLLKEVYPHAHKDPKNSKNMESTKKGKSEAIDKIDYKRAQTDSEYFQAIMSDPGLKNQYNEQMITDVSKSF